MAEIRSLQIRLMMDEDLKKFIEQQLPDDDLSPPVNGEEHLPFEKISPRAFEVLCLKVANKFFDDARIYGTPGQAQEGIDITCFENKPATDSKTAPTRVQVFLQCKRVKEFQAYQLKEAVEKFVEGEFGKQSSKFILCVTQRCDGTTFNKEYIKHKQFFRARDIEFLLWDASQLEEKLKPLPQIIYDIFDRDEHMQWTNRFCGGAWLKHVCHAFKAFPQKLETAPIENYIDRNVYFYKDENEKRSLYGIYNRSYSNLPDLIRQKESQKIILLSAAGAGKSAELKQLEHIFSNPTERLFPIRVSLNDYTGEGIEDFITCYHPDFKKYDPNKILLLLDGYDEIIATDLDKAVGKINQFVSPTGRYKNVRIVLSSRSNFYKENFKEFKTFFLDDVNELETWKYVSKILGHRNDSFKQIVTERNLTYLLSNAFNLIKLVQIFDKKGATNFPKNRAEAFEQIIEIKLEEDSKRPSEKLEFVYNKEKLRSAAELLAISMEQLGKNKITGIDFRKIITDEASRELLKYSFLINNNIVGKDEWQFEHNNFQEYLAAVVLSNLPVHLIKDLIAFKGHEKIKPRWVNTLSFLFSVLSSANDKHKELLKWLIDIEPEVVIKFEREVLSTNERLKIIAAVFEHYKAKGIILRSDSLQYSDIALFCGSETILIKYLFEEIKNAETNEHLVNIISTLHHLEIPFGFKDACKQILLDVIQSSKWEVYAVHDAVKCYLHQGFNSRDEINSLIASCPKIGVHRIRYSLYDYLLNTEWCDDYVDFFLEGLTIHKNETARNHIHDYSPDLVSCLHKCTRPDALKKILEFAIKHCDEEYKNGEDYYTYQDKKLVSETLIKTCIEVYPKDNSILEQMIKLARCFDRNHDKERASSLRKFFAETGTSLEAMLILIPEFLNHKSSYIYASVTDEKCNDYVVQQYLKAEVTADFVWETMFHIGWSGAKDLHDSLYSKINKATDNKFIYTDPINWEERKVNQHQTDLTLLENKDALLKEIENIFSSFEQEELTEDDLYAYRKNKFSEEGLAHTIPLRALQDAADKENPVSIKSIYAKFDEDAKWEWYVIYNLYQMLRNDLTIGEWHKKFITNWCYKELKKCDFKTAVWYNDNSQMIYHQKEYVVSFFWKHLNFTLEDSILLQMLCFDFSGIFIYHDKDKEQKSTLSDYVVERIADKTALEKEIIRHLKDADVIPEVAGSLIRQCKNLQLHQAGPYIIEWLMSGRVSEYNTTYLINAYLEIVPDKKTLIPILNTTDCSLYWHWHLIRLLYPEFREETTAHVTRCYDAQLIKDEYLLEALKLLINAGVEKAWLDFKEWIFANKNFGLNNPRDLDASNLNLQMVVPDLFELLVFSYNKDFGRGRIDDYSADVMELIFQAGLKSEEGFKLVMNAFDLCISNLSITNPEVRSLRYSQQRLERTYYLNKGDSVTMNEVIEYNKKIQSVLG